LSGFPKEDAKLDVTRRNEAPYPVDDSIIDFEGGFITFSRILQKKGSTPLGVGASSRSREAWFSCCDAVL